MKKLLIFERIFAAVGAVFILGVFLSIAGQVKFLAKARAVEGTVVGFKVDEVYFPIYVYEFPQGRIHRKKHNSGSNPATFTIGEKVTVYVNPGDPDDTRLAGFWNIWAGTMFAGLFGLSFGGAGFGMMFLRIRKSKLKAYLLRNGSKEKARITGVGLNECLSVNGEHPYLITAQMKMGEKLHVFKSGNIWYDPTEFIDREEVDVYFMPGNLKAHHMDISFLPELAE